MAHQVVPSALEPLLEGWSAAQVAWLIDLPDPEGCEPPLTPESHHENKTQTPKSTFGPWDGREIGILSPKKQRQHRTLHIQKNLHPYALC